MNKYYELPNEILLGHKFEITSFRCKTKKWIANRFSSHMSTKWLLIRQGWFFSFRFGWRSLSDVQMAFFLF